MVETCKDCGADIRRVVLPDGGAPIFLDAEPHPEGDFTLTLGGAMRLTQHMIDMVKWVPFRRYNAHTCCQVQPPAGGQPKVGCGGDGCCDMSCPYCCESFADMDTALTKP